MKCPEAARTVPGSMWGYRMNAKPILTRLAIATAPALFVLLWSTGFIGARYGVPYIEPLTFLAVRMAFAVAIMAAIALASGTRWLHAERSATASLQAL